MEPQEEAGSPGVPRSPGLCPRAGGPRGSPSGLDQNPGSSHLLLVPGRLHGTRGQPGHSDPVVCDRCTPGACSSELWVSRITGRTCSWPTRTRTFPLAPLSRETGPEASSCLHRAGDAAHHGHQSAPQRPSRDIFSVTSEGGGLHTLSLPDVSSKCAFVKFECGTASCFNRVVSR